MWSGEMEVKLEVEMHGLVITWQQHSMEQEKSGLQEISRNNNRDGEGYVRGMVSKGQVSAD